MTKELEYLNKKISDLEYRIAHPTEYTLNTLQVPIKVRIDDSAVYKKELETLKSIKASLEAIDNANPTEALEALENIKREAGTPYFSSLYDIDDWKNDFNTVRQALLNEQKQYLKWEDLKFESNWKYQEVKLNGTKYTIKYKCGFDFFDNYYEVVKIYNQNEREQLFKLYDNKQFFNDLHLERVEE